jgi:hypothetical protein
VFSKEMVVAAQRVAYESASAQFCKNPTGDAWRSLEIEMWAWQKLKQMDEPNVLEMLRNVSAKEWSVELNKACGR